MEVETLKDTLTVKTRLDGVIHTAIPQTPEQNIVYQARGSQQRAWSGCLEDS